MAINAVREWFTSARELFKKPDIEAHETQDIINNLYNKAVIRLCKRFSQTKKNILFQWLQDYANNKVDLTDQELLQINVFLENIKIGKKVIKIKELEVEKVEQEILVEDDTWVVQNEEEQILQNTSKPKNTKSIQDLLAELDTHSLKANLIKEYTTKYKGKAGDYVEEDIFLARINTFWLKYISILSSITNIERTLSLTEITKIENMIQRFKDPEFYANWAGFFKELLPWIDRIEPKTWLTLEVIADVDITSSLDDQARYVASLDLQNITFPPYWDTDNDYKVMV